MAASLIFPLVGVAWDLRRTGTIHPAWGTGLAAMVGCLLVTEAITYSPVGAGLYREVTAGSPGAAVASLKFRAPPSVKIVTGRSASN